MNIVFDYFNQISIPNFYLSNPDGTALYNLGTIKDRKFELRFNSLSTFSFTAPAQINGVDIDYYNFLEYRRLVNVENIGVFMITDISTEGEGIKETKSIVCKSLEVIFNYKKLSLFQGTYNFYDIYNPQGTLLHELLSYVPGWGLGTIDPALLGVYRSFDVTDKTLYDFMVNEVSQTFQCVFVFDSINKTVSAYSLPNATTTSDIFISFDNLMKSFTITESTNELVTAMNVIGGEGLEINLVNPIGTNTIYNFDYYKTTRWMAQDLIDALDLWEGKITTWQPIYANLLTSLRVENTALIGLESDLVTLQGELASLQSLKDVMTQQGLPTTEVSASMVVVNQSITDTSASIVVEEGIITGIQSQLTYINSDLSFTNPVNFTSTQLSNLNNFIIGNTYTNVNFISTTTMTEVQVQDAAQDLYDEGVNILEKVSQPRYTFDINSANFLFIKEYQPFIDQLEMGCVMTIELKSGTYVYPALLGIDFSYDDPLDFKMVLSNRLRLDDPSYMFLDIYGSAIDSGVTTNFNSQKWNSVSDSYNSSLSSGLSYVSSATTSSASNICLFNGITGTTIKDGGAMYVAPSAFASALNCSGATFGYSYNVGNYNIIGRNVFFEESLSLNSLSGSSTNQLYLSIPSAIHRTSASVTASFYPCYEGITLSAGYTDVVGLLPSGASQIMLQQQGSGKILLPITSSMLSASATKIYLSGQYFID